MNTNQHTEKVDPAPGQADKGHLSHEPGSLTGKDSPTHQPQKPGRPSLPGQTEPNRDNQSLVHGGTPQQR